MLEFATANWLIRALILTALFGIVVFGSLMAINYSTRRVRLARDLARIAEAGDQSAVGRLAREDKEGAWTRLAKRIERAGLNLTDTADEKLVRLLRTAGYHSPTAPRIYTLVRIILVFTLPGLFILMNSFADEPPTLTRLYLTCSILALLGLYIPNLFVRAKADRRRRKIVNGFPDSLDLMLVCVEAGLGLEAALNRVGREVVHTHPLISQMLSETTLLMRAGASRENALRKMGEVTGVDEIRSFATLLIQTDKLGTSISNTLRVYSAEMREKRRLRAEEKAHRLPVLISIPLVVCMLPTMIGVLTLPAIVLVIREIMPALTGG